MRRRLKQFVNNLISSEDSASTKQKRVVATGDNQDAKPEAMSDSEADNAPQQQTAPRIETAPLSRERGSPPDALAERAPGAGAKEPRLEIANRCHVGNVRPRNEDSSFVFYSQNGGADPLPLFGLFIVADGMGGHHDGHRASRLVARTMAQHILDQLYRSLLREGQNAMQQPVQEVMEEAVALANRALAGAENGKDMGTTLTAAIILGSRLFLVHIGDSRAYLMHDGELSLVTTDHTFVQAMQDAGQLTAEEAALHPNRNMVYRALMGDAMEEPVDISTCSLPQNGCLILCSDGLSGQISDATIAGIMAQEITLQDRADLLLEAALAAGGHDNITVILVAFAY